MKSRRPQPPGVVGRVTPCAPWPENAEAARRGLPRPTFTALLLLMLALVQTLHAQSYSLDWFTVDGGGGTSTGGVYSVSGTIGQPDAGAMTGGNYSLTGGFWSLFALQTPGAPLLLVARSNAAVIVSWPLPADGWVLVSTTNLVSAPQTNVWTQVPFPYQTNATSIRVTEPAPVGRKFYRLRKP